jgi:hypothetical protein
MLTRVLRRHYVWPKVDWQTIIAYPVLFVTLLTAMGITLLHLKLISNLNLSLYVAVVAFISNRVCAKSGLIAAALSVLQYEWCFADGVWRLNTPLPEQAFTYVSMCGAVYLVGRHTPPWQPPNVRDQTAEPLPFTSISKSDQSETRSCWDVRASGLWGDDSKLGLGYGLIYVERLRSPAPAPLLGHIVKDMMRRGKFSGIEAGFLSMVSLAASGNYPKRRRPASFDRRPPGIAGLVLDDAVRAISWAAVAVLFCQLMLFAAGIFSADSLAISTIAILAGYFCQVAGVLVVHRRLRNAYAALTYEQRVALELGAPVLGDPE